MTNTVRLNQSLVDLVERLLSIRGSQVQLGRENIWQAIAGALEGRRLINNLAETLRLSASDTEQLLVREGFGDIVAQAKLQASSSGTPAGPQRAFVIGGDDYPSQLDEFFSVEWLPPLDQAISLDVAQHDAVTLLLGSMGRSIESDPFIKLYRKDVLAYHDAFIQGDGKEIMSFLRRHFGENMEHLRYIVNSGIGANEQFNHYVAGISNANPDRRVTWLITNSPRHLCELPADCTLDNTVFMEFSRSGKTEETVKIHELTPRTARRLVFANSGPLRALGKRDADYNLTLDLPDEVSGRFGRNKTPILLAPMLVAGLDTKRYWETIERAIDALDISSTTCLPAQIAQSIYLHQLSKGVNDIYLGCNDDLLLSSADEFVQFWNEGVNKDGNDLLMSRYFGLLRDSHASIEGVLGNASRKLAIFLFADVVSKSELPPLTCEEVDPIDPDHAGLKFGDEEAVLAQANYEHMARVMPCVRIKLHGAPNLDHSAVLGQLWSDITYFYSKLRGVDPGSNPEVKHVRDRSAALLAAEAARRRSASR
jgi:hypothetical protein